MKKWLPLFLLLVITGRTSLQAQVRLGFLGGVHSASVLETNNIPGWDTATKPYNKPRAGFQLGVLIDIPIGHTGLFFQPAITYTSKGRSYKKNNDSVYSLNTDTIQNRQALKLGYIEVPLNLTYKLSITANHRNNIFISAGPMFSFFNNGKLTTESLNTSTNTYNGDTEPVAVGKGANTYKTLDIGVNGRVGIEMGSIMLSGYYSRSLTSFYNAPYPGTFHHQVVGLSLGIWLSSAGAPPPLRKRDTDKDGINDEEDQCPLQPGTLAWHGCPVPDTDHDGIDDDHDSCRNIPGVARYNGCPIPDTDHDGIDDEHDSCPTVPGLARYNGCPIPDRDHDGLNDEVDKCPDSAGPVENHGCPLPIPQPEIKKEATDQINFIAHNVLFNPGSDKLTDGSFIALDQLAALLLAHPSWHLTIEGYTDNSGTPEKNLQLSAKRAGAVKDYLISKAVPTTRLTATGFGQQNPIADNRTLKGKSANRRVELKLSLQ